MKITVEFDNEAEFEAFRTSGKRTRAKKGDGDEGEAAPGPANAPAPIQPPPPNTTGFNPSANMPGATAGFAPPAPGAAPGSGFPAPGAAQPAAEVVALVLRITNRINALLAAGQGSPDQILGWFRGEIGKTGLDASAADMNTIQNALLPKMTAPTLENITKLIGA